MKYVIIKPTTSCNFNCAFCSAKLLNIPLQKTVPNVLKEYLLSYKPDSLIITGGEPLINTKEYFEELISIMESITPNYSISLTSNMVLWFNNPEKFDYLFNNPHIGVITSFQYGGERKDKEDYNETRFIELFNKFYDRYKLKLHFIYVVNNDNEKYIEDACKLARRLDTRLKLNQQLPLGLSKTFYPRYKLLEQHIKMIKLGYSDVLESLDSIRNNTCPFPISYHSCKQGRVVYVDKDNKLVVNNCEDIISSRHKIEITNDFLYNKCVTCKMFRLCNTCAVNRFYTNKEEQCKWMLEHKEDIDEYLCSSDLAL
jgi:organic radical activating enzyme